MNFHELLKLLGIDPAVLYAGAFGGMVLALSRRRFNKIREMIASPICGALATAYLTIPTVHYIKATGWPLPP